MMGFTMRNKCEGRVVSMQIPITLTYRVKTKTLVVNPIAVESTGVTVITVVTKSAHN